MGGHNARGFSLAEVLVALTILGFIGMLTYGAFARASDSRDQAQQMTQRYHQIRQGMLRMAREISMAFISEHRNCEDPRTKTIFAGKRSGGGMRLDFTSFSHTKTAPDANESDQEELSYFVESDPKRAGENALFRRVQPRIDDTPDEGGIEQVLVENVSELSFEFYDPKEDRWIDDWDTTRSDYRGKLPMFVAIKLTAKGPATKDEVFITKTRVFLDKALLIPGTLFSRCME